MLQFILNQNLLLYVCGAACALGVISQFLLKHLYERLIRETQDTVDVRGKFIQQMRQRFHNCRHLNEKVNDIPSFTERSIMDYEFLKMNLHQWQRIWKEALAICLLCCGMGAWLLYRNGTLLSPDSSYGRAAVLSTLLICLACGLTDNKYRHYSLKIRLMDYLQNSGAAKEYRDIDLTEKAGEVLPDAAAETAASASGTLGKKLRRSMKLSAETRAQREKRELKETLSREKAGQQEIAAAKEGEPGKENSRNLLKQMDPKEKEEILREVLLEFLT